MAMRASLWVALNARFSLPEETQEMGVAEFAPSPDLHAEILPSKNDCEVGDRRANVVSQSEAVLVAARCGEGGSLMPRRPCGTCFVGLMPKASM